MPGIPRDGHCGQTKQAQRTQFRQRGQTNHQPEYGHAARRRSNPDQAHDQQQCRGAQHHSQIVVIHRSADEEKHRIKGSHRGSHQGQQQRFWQDFPGNPISEQHSPRPHEDR